MNSTSYFFNMHGGIVFFITFGLMVVMLILTLAFNLWLGKKFKLSKSITKVLLMGTFFSGMAAIFFGSTRLKAKYDHGGIKKFYVLPSDSGPILSVWCTRIYPKRVGADYDQHIRTYDLATGESTGSIQIDQKYFSDDYRLYRAEGNLAWGYRKGLGLMLIDLQIPKIVASNDAISQQLSHLGDELKFEAFRDAYDPNLTGLYLNSGNGRFYRLHEDFSTSQVTSLPVGVDKKQEWTFTHNWYFDPLKHSLGKHAHTQGTGCDTENSITLLDPDFIPEKNYAITNKEKVWVTHKSTILGDYDLLISYMSGDGIEHSRINVSEIINGDDLKVLSTYTIDKFVTIFISTGDTFRAIIKGFSLSALRVDASTGELINIIHYF